MMKLALAQINVEGADVDGNVSRALDAVEAATADGADLVALPELFNVGYFAFDAYARLAESIAGPTLERIRDAAIEHHVGILAGSIVEDLAATRRDTDVHVPAEDGFANTSVFFDRDGSQRAVYRKIHLFGYDSAETRLLTPGDTVATTDFEDFTVGMLTCYDMRFPELVREITTAGATLVLVPSAWPYPRIEHWEVLSRARAIENQVYVGTINGAGDFEDASLLGRSTIFDPWGTVLASSGDDPAIVTTDIDANRVGEIRTEFPAWRDRRR